VPALLAVVFILLGVALIPYAGIEADEALIALPLYAPPDPTTVLKIGSGEYPLMLMSYLGTLKTYLYKPWFRHWRPGVWSLRLPVVLIGAITVLLFYNLLRRSHGLGAAIAGAALLTTDATYIMTTVFDWGPVALQHLLMTGGALLVLSFAQGGSWIRLFLGFLFFGLGVWDKALFSWTLSGAAVAALAVFPREVWRHVTLRNLGLAAAGFLIGATPLIIYNVQNNWATFGNAKFSTAGLKSKAHLAYLTMQGSSLFGYMVAEEWPGPVRSPGNAFERVSVGLQGIGGERRQSLTFWAFAAAVLAAPLWWRIRRPVLFGLLLIAVAWAQMLFTEGTGGGAHHVALLWPWPHFVMAVVLAAAAARVPRGPLVAGGLVAVLCMSNLLLVNQHLVQFIRYGTSNIWTDAIIPLYDYLKTQQKGRHVFAMDWGIIEPIRMLDRGRSPFWSTEDVIAPGADGTQMKRTLGLKGLFVSHVEGREVNAGVNGRLREMTAKFGYERNVVATIMDRNGRPVFEIAEYEPSHGGLKLALP
jgi:hypothetical protein